MAGSVNSNESRAKNSVQASPDLGSDSEPKSGAARMGLPSACWQLLATHGDVGNRARLALTHGGGPLRQGRAEIRDHAADCKLRADF